MNKPRVKCKSRREQCYATVLDLYYKQGKNCTEISKEMCIAYSTIYYWIGTFEEESKSSVQMGKAKRPETAMPDKSDASEYVQALEKELEALKECLARQTLRADIYDEMIDVAEAKFKISIREKLAPSSREPARKVPEAMPDLAALRAARCNQAGIL